MRPDQHLCDTFDQWFEQQSRERNRKKREELLHKIQQKVYDEAYFLPIWQLGFLCVTGPRVAVSGLGLIPDYIYSAPYTYCISNVIYSVVSSEGYNGRHIGQRGAQELAVR
jgi:ABC-type transport system substrate-binding protein